MPASLRSDGVRVHPGMPFGFPSESAFGFAGILTSGWISAARGFPLRVKMGLKKSSRPIAYSVLRRKIEAECIRPMLLAIAVKSGRKSNSSHAMAPCLVNALVLKPDETVIHCKIVARMKRVGRL